MRSNEVIVDIDDIEIWAPPENVGSGGTGSSILGRESTP